MKVTKQNLSYLYGTFDIDNIYRSKLNLVLLKKIIKHKLQPCLPKRFKIVGTDFNILRTIKDEQLGKRSNGRICVWDTVWNQPSIDTNGSCVIYGPSFWCMEKELHIYSRNDRPSSVLSKYLPLDFKRRIIWDPDIKIDKYYEKCK